MIPNKLVLHNFKCYQDSEINFDNFNIAVIIGSQSGNSNISNAVGKTAIFESIEYCLFNYSNSKLDNLINDNSDEMFVELEFSNNSNRYKIKRQRSRKGQDVSFFIEENSKWKDMSGRRASDTEDIIKSIIKIDFNTFRSTAYFPNKKDDFSLALISPENRKKLLKDVLNIGYFSKLEKITKEKFQVIESKNTQLVALEKVYKDKVFNQEKLDSLNKQIFESEKLITKTDSILNKTKDKVQESIQKLAKLSQDLDQLKKDNKHLLDLIKSTNDLYESKSKKYDLLLQQQKSELNFGKNLVESKKSILSQLDLLKPIMVDSIIEDLSSTKSKIQALQDSNNILKQQMENLKMPSIVSDKCNLCGSTLDKEHLEKERARIISETNDIKAKISTNEVTISSFQQNVIEFQQKIQLSKDTQSKIQNLESKKNDILTNIAVHKTKYDATLSSLKTFGEEKQEVKKQIDNLPNPEDFNKKSKSILDLISKEQSSKQTLLDTEKELLSRKDIETQKLAMLKVQLESNKQVEKDLLDTKQKILEIHEDMRTYPYVIQAFSSTGIPSIIISSILDELQEEANIILNKIHPGLQLQFLTEKERKKDKEIEDKLNIIYYAHGKERSIDELSGAQGIAVQFAIKIGLAFLLKKSAGYNFGLLLLDEVDSPLDEQSIGFFSDILKSFQNEFKILTISHNNYSKEKIPNHILIEQDKSKMITRIKN